MGTWLQYFETVAAGLLIGKVVLLSLVVAPVNQTVWGLHPLRAAFMAATVLFAGYLVWRREVFAGPEAAPSPHGRARREVPRP